MQIEIVKNVQGKFGPQVLLANKKYASFSPKFNGDKNPVPGMYEAEVYTSEKGNMYLNSLKLVQGASAAAVKHEPKRSKGEDAPNWDEINRGKVKSLFVEALLSNPNVVQDLEDVPVDMMKSVVDQLTDYVFGK